MSLDSIYSDLDSRQIKLIIGTLSKKKNDIIWEFFPNRGGGSSQIPKLLSIYQVFFCMPNSFRGAKRCFTYRGR